MSNQFFSFREEQFSKLFPFYLRVNDRLEIVAIGKTLRKLGVAKEGEPFTDAFTIKRPATEVSHFEDLQGAGDQMLVMHALRNEQVVLRGQIEILPETHEALFIGTPWFGSMDQVTGSNLTIHDFALHDSMIDLLHVLKTQEITNDDLKQMFQKVNQQKRELQQAKKQLEEMARFPMQNPDALVRIGFDGKVLLMNPSAEKLSAFSYEGKEYSVEAFWKMIAAEGMPDADTWQFETVSAGRTYSFLCKKIPGLHYFNVYGRDVTEKLLVEKNLLISEQNFRVMGENIPGLIYLWRLNFDGSSQFEYMSPRLESELGVPMSELEKLASYIHPDDLEEWGKRVQDAFENNSTFEYNGRLLLPGNKVIWMQCASRIAYEDTKGKVFSGFFKNVTTEKHRQLEFERLSLVASANNNAVLFTDPLGRITWANEGYTRMVGFTLEETLGKTPIELCRGPLTDYDTVKQVVNSFFAGNAFQADVIYYRKDGSWFWGRSVTQPVKNEEGLVTEFFGIIEDITLEKEQEAQLNLLSKIAEDNVNAVIVADAHGNIEWVNRSFETMTGYSLQEVKGKKPGHFLQGPGTDPNTREYLRQQIGKGEAFECEILNYHKDGTSYWLRIHGQALKNEKGLVTKYFAIEEDITRQKEAAVKMREAEARFKLAIEKMGDNVWEHNFQTGDTMFSVLERDLVGYDKEEFESSADLWWKCVVEEDRHLLLQSDQAYRSGQQDQHSMEYRMRHKSGQIIWILDRGVVIERDKSGKPLRILGTHTNITHVKHTEAELAQRVKQFKSLSENIPGVIYEYEFRPDGTEGLRYVSPAIEEVFGISPADFVNYGSYIHPDDLPRIREKNKQSREQQLPFYDEARLRIPGGREIWHSVSSSFSYFTEDGSAVYTGFMQDITERKQAEQELEKQRKFYEDILNNMPADIAVFSPNHEYLFVNPKGIKDAELRNWIIGKRDEDYCQYRNKPLSLAAERRATFNKVLETKEASEWEERTTQENGDVGYVLRRWFPVANEAGNVELVLGYGVDITKRKMAEDALRINEEKYRGIIANMNLGMMEIDSQGKITFANQSFAQMTGKGADELIGTDSFQLLSEKSMAEYPDRLKRRKKGLSEAYELQPVLPGNNNAWWLVSAAPKFDEKGEFSGTIVITLDITAQKHLQHELEESREQAQQLAKAKETFLANMSHEIRTPMNAIMGLSRQLRKTKLDEQQRFFLDSVLTASDNLLVIINDILDLSKIEAGKLSLEAIAFSPKEMLGKVSHMLMHRAEEKGLWMQVSIDEEVGPIVVGDPYRLNQVLLNLAGNAIKFTANGGVTLGLHLLQEKDGQQLLRFSVIDTGIGISDEFKANMFEAFAQEYRSTSRNFGGTGLGLAISRQLVELMNGQLQVESEKGKGAIFSFDILLPKGNPSDLVASGEVGIEQNVLQGKNILLVEDNSMNRLVASTILGQYGARVSEAENGKTALEVLGADGSNIDLVLMDMQMPVMDGITATKLIRSGISSDLPVIALTANALPSEKAHCLEAGMNDFISKPFDETAFVRTIAQWLDEEPTGMQASPPDIVKQEQSVASTPAITSPYSLNTLQSISRGNESFVKKMAQMFCDQAPVLAEEMKAFLTNGQLDQMGSVAHKLKPTIDSMEMENLKEIIRMIEKAGKSGEHSPELLQWVNNTVEQIGMAVKDLKENYL